MDVFIAGVGMTAFGDHPHLSVRDLAGAALREALAEHSETLAGIERGISVSKEEEERERTLIGFKLAAAAAAAS